MKNNPYVFYDSQHEVLLCKYHQCAITMKSLVIHFRDKHDITKEARQKIIDYASKISIKEARELTYSTEKINPIPYLKVIEGYSCEYSGCDLICGTLESVKHHCKLVHEWKAKDGVTWNTTRAQTFYQNNQTR
jgi:Orsellinic acid/F9775 biosynthesis cluster protein D